MTALEMTNMSFIAVTVTVTRMRATLLPALCFIGGVWKAINGL
jgi:hypothetical protein